MRKSAIYVVAAVMGAALAGLLGVQLSYIKHMTAMKRAQFSESVARALSDMARDLETEETRAELERSVNDAERRAAVDMRTVKAGGGSAAGVKEERQYAVTGDDGTIYSSFETHTIKLSPKRMDGGFVIREVDGRAADRAKSNALREAVRERYVYQRAMLDEVVYGILYTAADRPLARRINFKRLDRGIRSRLRSNGVELTYHFTVSDSRGKEVYRCAEYDAKGADGAYVQPLFRNDPGGAGGMLTVHFPEAGAYVYSGLRFMVPALAFTGVILVAFLFSLWVLVRERRVSEMRRDFVNNMTHELKTPVASISLAAQMLTDDSMPKGSDTVGRLGKVIADESRRLRFLVEKVLQTSLFDSGSAAFRMKEVDINALAATAAESFALRVEHTGGKIHLRTDATAHTVMGEETHLGNALFNLMDNAVKYRKPDIPLYILISTKNEGGRILLSVRDNGMGINRGSKGKVFERFYRAHTGNRHDVKGFGLGLAYVKKVAQMHGGSVSVRSEPDKGAEFTITLDCVKHGEETDTGTKQA